MVVQPTYVVSNRDKTKLFLERCASKLGVSAWISTKSSAEEIRGLISLFRPYDTGIPLVRIGADQDGGYLVPDDLAGILNCFSPGVDRTATFEKTLSDRGIKCHLADRSVDGPPSYLGDCTFVKKYLASYNSSSTITLDEWIRMHDLVDDHELLLQMDIEGAEYEVLSSINPETLRQFRIVVIELHDLHHVLHPVFLKIVRAILHKLLIDFTIVHIHPNNCLPCVQVGDISIPPLIEVTLLRKDRGYSPLPIKSMPHSLDRPNLPNAADIEFQQIWWER